MDNQVYKYLLIDECVEDEVVVHTALHVVEAMMSRAYEVEGLAARNSAHE